VRGGPLLGAAVGGGFAVGSPVSGRKSPSGGGRGELGQGGGLGETRTVPATRATRLRTVGDVEGEALGVPPVRAISNVGGAGDGCPQT
jgi:hypothetical protein